MTLEENLPRPRNVVGYVHPPRLATTVPVMGTPVAKDRKETAHEYGNLLQGSKT